MSLGASRVVAALALSWTAAAFAAEPAPGVGQLRPTGPIKVTARHAEFDERGKRMLYRGKVQLTSNELELRGERLELERAGKGAYTAHVTGSPALLTHAGNGDIPALSARANDIVYDTQASLIALSGGAVVTRGNDELVGDSIRYDPSTRRIKASGLNGGQIRLVIEQPGKDLDKDKAGSGGKP